MNIMESPQKGGATPFDGTDPDFVWQDYLDDTKSVAAASSAFTHVEYSLESGFKVGMKLEIPNPDDVSAYWLASVVMICGDLLTLRYAGYGDDRSADFWFNIKSGEFHQVGWCSSNNKKLWPPKCVLDKHPNVNALLNEQLQNTESIPANLSEDLNAGFMPIDQIKCGMKLEISEEFNPENIWIATIVQNVGGRLLLRYDVGEEAPCKDVWQFYLSDRLYPIGYAKEQNYQYCPPAELKDSNNEDQWNIILKKSLQEAKKMPFPAHIFEPKLPLEKHEFKEGMKLEVVNTQNYTELSPATISKVVNDFYFLVSIDSHTIDEDSQCTLCCHSNSPFIFPVKWAEENELDLTIPKGYEVDQFSWDKYLEFCSAVAAPMECFPMMHMNMGFEAGMKLEAADPLCPSNIHAATVAKLVDPLMYLHFDSEEDEHKYIISSITSFDIYPVGWCASNFYPLRTPSTYKSKSKISIAPQPKEESTEKSSQDVPTINPSGQHCKSWCPQIYFNHRCFTGPLLSKSRLAELPQAIGPGPLHLVIQEVIYRVVNIAYKSSRVLQILQIQGKPTAGMQQQMIKAKYKGKTNRATIEVITNSEQVEDFCKNICAKLECCPYLFGPKHVGETCPSSCHTQTKTKFGYNFVKKQKKLGRPPLSASNASSCDNGDVVKRGPGRKKKRKHWSQLLSLSKKAEEDNKEKIPASVESSETDDGSKCDPKDKVTLQPGRIPLMGKKKLKHTPSSSIVTRGAKLPNFGLWHHVSSFHSRRGRPRTKPIRPFTGVRKVGRPVGSTKKAIAAQLKSRRLMEACEEPIEEESEPEVVVTPPKPTLLDSNPLEWSVEDVVQYLQKTEYAPLAPILKDQEIDGQALLMLNHFSVREYLHLKPEPAEKFCYLIKNLKIEFFTHYVS